MQIDVFNGDADGLCSLLQLRLAKPCASKLITSFKRDITLLTRVHANRSDNLTVLDISLQKNHHDLVRLLDQGVNIFYIDHHLAGTIPQHAQLKTLINTQANTCTSLLVNHYLNGDHYLWAIVGGFGDNMPIEVIQAVNKSRLDNTQLDQLKTLGICLNYNGYGTCIEDLHFAPDALYRELEAYQSPFDFMSNNLTIYQQLVQGYEDDMEQAAILEASYSNEFVAIYQLPNTLWARRVSGVFANDLANKYPNRAHAIISHNKQQGYQISVRAPLTNKTGAGELCALFSTGGGRKSAAGINHLTDDELPRFKQLFEKQY
ncbi:MAG: DHH family phosphoesterase [Methylococcales bacterium]|nr:DHH family phosphoesterase [Methylococcales bacterium]